MAELTAQYLAGNMLMPRTMIQAWINTITSILPLTTGVVTTQFTTAQTGLVNILNATPTPNLLPSQVVIPINIVNNLQQAFNNFEHAYGGPFATNQYQDTVSLVDDVLSQYNSDYYTSMPVSYFIFSP